LKNIVLSGNWSDSLALVGALSGAGLMVSVLPENESFPGQYDLMITKVSDPVDLIRPPDPAKPWLACCRKDEVLTTRAYQAGAIAVFAEDTPPEVVLRIVQRNLENLASRDGHNTDAAVQRHYQRGDVILLEAETVLEVHRGIIAQTMIYQDGAEVLLGLCGPSQLLVPHPADNCYIQLISHTDSLVTIKSWEQKARDPDFAEKMRARLQQMEAWAAIQARPRLDQRVLGILSLLAEQFGVPLEEGQLVDVRITHSQLASAVGATRTTITRTLGDLRRQGILSLVQTHDGERYCLQEWEPGDHGFGL
jgi:hypothetical protein